MDFFSPWQTNVTDTSSLFILQLACIVNMVPRWKKMKIRVFLAARDCSSRISGKSTNCEIHEEYNSARESEDLENRYCTI